MISILIVNYNTDHLLVECLRSLESHRHHREYEIVVVNNGRPSPLGELDSLDLDLRVISNRRNIGYAAALNQAAQLTKNPMLLCLNADTEIPPDALMPLCDFLSVHPECGVVAPKLVYPDGNLQYSCRRSYTCGGILGRRLPIGFLPMLEPALRHHLMLDEDHSRLLHPDWVQGSCMMIPRSVFQALGGFDQKFFLYLEDYDFCARVREQGLSVSYLPESTVVHYYARSSSNLNIYRKEFWLHVRSAMRYYRKTKKRRAPMRLLERDRSTEFDRLHSGRTEYE